MLGSCVVCVWIMYCVGLVHVFQFEFVCLDHVLCVIGSCVVCDWTMCCV